MGMTFVFVVNDHFGVVGMAFVVVFMLQHTETECKDEKQDTQQQGDALGRSVLHVAPSRFLVVGSLCAFVVMVFIVNLIAFLAIGMRLFRRFLETIDQPARGNSHDKQDTRQDQGLLWNHGEHYKGFVAR